MNQRSESLAFPDIDESTFRLFLRWCHSQLRPSSNNEGKLTIDDYLSNRLDSPISEHFISDASEFSNVTLLDEFGDNPPQYLESYSVEELNDRYYNNPIWISSYQHISMSLLKLYIFADKYSVDQLRDDILSALMGYSLSWQWWPDPEHVELINGGV